MNDLQTGIVKKINILHNEIRGDLKKTFDKAIRIGGLLADQKESLEHGQFTTWVESNLDFDIRTAQRYMKVHNNREQLKSDSVSFLTEGYKQLEKPTEKSKEELLNEAQEFEKKRKDLMIKFQTIDFPTKKYGLIYMNPPWGKIESEIILDLDIKKISDKNCILYIWFLPDEDILPIFMRIDEAWGLKYRSSAVWDLVKPYKENAWLKIRHMLLLIYKKGSGCPLDANRTKSIQHIESDDPNKKPERFREILEKQFPERTKLMIFSDKKYVGWDVWNPF